MDINQVLLEQESLKQKLLKALEDSVYPLDFIVTHSEINNRHGTGILLKRIFNESTRRFIIRSRNLYQGEHDLAPFHPQVYLAHEGLSRTEINLRVKTAIKSSIPQRIISFPYYSDEVLTTLALKDLFDVPLCTYIMDDQNIFAKGISDELLGELIERSDLCLGISQEMCQAYEQKFHRKFCWLPPVVPPHLILKHLKFINFQNLENKKGILIGNLWSQQWLDRLRIITKETNSKIDWYGNPNRSWLIFDDQELDQDGINLKNYLPEEELSVTLQKYLYTVIPTGSTEELEDRPEIAKLSLPSRLPFILASSHTPVIVMGSRDTAVARFVENFEIGYVCDYDSESFREAIEKICSPDIQTRMRQKAASLAHLFSSEGIEDWIWQSLSLGKPVDFRFEKLRGVIENANVVITANEVTQKHGTGALVKRIVGDTPDILSIRGVNHYNGDHNWGDVSVLLPLKGFNRVEAFQKILGTLQDSTVQRVLCVPYYSEDLVKAIAIKELFNVSLGVYIMDDQNICVNEIPDELMKEFLSKCSLRLATHPELRDAYEAKYGFKFWLLPAVVPDHLIYEKGLSLEENYFPNQTGALIGSIWSQKWLEMLCNNISKAGITLEWFGNPNSCYWLDDPHQTLQNYGINVCGLLPEDELADKLKTYPYVIVPTGTLDERDDRWELSRLSLPGRIIMAMATSNIPVIILGSEKTSAARFVKRFGIGLSCDYDGDSLRKTVEYITQPHIQEKMRQNAARVARQFSARGISEWLWQSIELGQPVDLRFEDLFPRSPGDIIPFIEPPVPNDIHREYRPVYEVSRRLKGQGFNPDFVVDVGSSDGIWSYTASRFFDQTRFILIDPLMSKYEQDTRDYYLKRIPKVELLELAVSNQSGQMSFQVSPDLYGSSLLNPADFRNYETVEVEVKTLNDIARERKITGRGLLKLDVQCAEHLVLEGADQFLDQVDAIVAELSLVRYDPQARILLEMLQLMDDLGFRYYDETSEWRSPVDGTLLQKEILFIRKHLLVPATSRQI